MIYFSEKLKDEMHVIKKNVGKKIFFPVIKTKVFTAAPTRRQGSQFREFTAAPTRRQDSQFREFISGR